MRRRYRGRRIIRVGSFGHVQWNGEAMDGWNELIILPLLKENAWDKWRRDKCWRNVDEGLKIGSHNSG
ncbi:hypothetical protein Leryth_025098 [Lithospermum erythrorhizon]|nr:hypothetical protein Leryth_025098 [Lithospermum erythrorhizon]